MTVASRRRLAGDVPHPAADRARLSRCARGDVLRVIDPHGEQVSDLFAFARRRPDVQRCPRAAASTTPARSTCRPATCCGRTTAAPCSRSSRDDVRRHDFLLTPCSQEMFEILYQHRRPPSELLREPVQRVRAVRHRPGRASRRRSTSSCASTSTARRRGRGASRRCRRRATTIELRAEMDTGVRADGVLGRGVQQRTFKPIDFAIVRAGSATAARLMEAIVERLVALIDRARLARRVPRRRRPRSRRGPARPGAHPLARRLPARSSTAWRAGRRARRATRCLVHDKLVEFHFCSTSRRCGALQSPVGPAASSAALTPLSPWIVDFAATWGDVPRHAGVGRAHGLVPHQPRVPLGRLHAAAQRLSHVQPVLRAPRQARPASGRGARRPARAGRRRPTRRSSAHGGPRCGSTIFVEDARLSVKGLRWSLAQLLDDSPYADRFAGGMVTHRRCARSTITAGMRRPRPPCWRLASSTVARGST